jgi:hypothetical protein
MKRGLALVEIAATAVVADHQVNAELRRAIRRRPAERAIQEDAVVRLDAYEIDVHKTLTRSYATVRLYLIESRPPSADPRRSGRLG